MTDITWQTPGGGTSAMPVQNVYVRASDGAIVSFSKRHGFRELEPDELAAALAQVSGLGNARDALRE